MRDCSAQRPGLAVLAVLTILAVGCGSSAGGGGGGGDASSVQLSADQYGSKWPLTVKEGTLRCEGVQSVVFEANGSSYGVNGSALDQGFKDIHPIWKDDPALKGLKISISPLINRGLALCR